MAIAAKATVRVELTPEVQAMFDDVKTGLAAERDEWQRRAERLESVARQAHAAMNDWRRTHGNPDGYRNLEESAMDDACLAIDDLLGDDDGDENN